MHFDNSFTYNSGIDPVDSMFFYYFHIGLLLPTRLNKSLIASFYISGGLEGGHVDRWDGYSFFLPALPFLWLQEAFEIGTSIKDEVKVF